MGGMRRAGCQRQLSAKMTLIDLIVTLFKTKPDQIKGGNQLKRE